MTGARAGIALVFPGQGAQARGMGAAAVDAGAGVELLAASRRLGCDLAHLVRDADDPTLRRTENAQPALFYTEWAVAEALVRAGVRPCAVAGHSLGEWVAIAAADALDPVTALELVIERGRLMAAAATGTMAAVLGAPRAVVEAACARATAAGHVCVVANDNAPGQTVISGTPTGVERTGADLQALGVGRVVALRVSGAFHSPLMAPAARAFRERLAAVPLHDPRVPVAANATGAGCTTAATLRPALADQLERPVLWVDDVHALAAAGAATFIECGPGATLAGLIRRILPGAVVHRAATPEDARTLVGGW